MQTTFVAIGALRVKIKMQAAKIYKITKHANSYGDDLHDAWSDISSSTVKPVLSGHSIVLNQRTQRQMVA